MTKFCGIDGFTEFTNEEIEAERNKACLRSGSYEEKKQG